MIPSTVLFDLDNTLTHRRQSVTAFARRFWADFGAKLGSIEFEHVENLIQLGDGGGYRPKAEMFAMMARDLPWLEPMVAEVMRDYWYRQSPKCMIPREGMSLVLDRLQENNVRLGMITNGRTVVQNATIDALGIRHFFEVILISEAVSIRKPDRQIFEMALEKLDSQAEMTWYVGDNPTSDIGGAKNAGLRTVWVSDGQMWNKKLPSPDFEVRELIKLLEIWEMG